MSVGMFVLVLFGGLALIFGVAVLIRKFTKVDGWRLCVVMMGVMSVWAIWGWHVSVSLYMGMCDKQVLSKENMIVPDVLRCENHVWVTTSDGERVYADLAETDGESYFVQERWSTWGVYDDYHYCIYIGTDADKEVSADELRAYLPKWRPLTYCGGAD